MVCATTQVTSWGDCQRSRAGCLQRAPSRGTRAGGRAGHRQDPGLWGHRVCRLGLCFSSPCGWQRVLSHDAVFPNQEKEPAGRRCGRQPFSCPGHPELGSAVGPACAHASLPRSRDSRPLTRPDVAQVMSGELTDTGGLFPAPAVLSPQQGPGEGGHHVWSEGPRGPTTLSPGDGGKGHVTPSGMRGTRAPTAPMRPQATMQ